MLIEETAKESCFVAAAATTVQTSTTLLPKNSEWRTPTQATTSRVGLDEVGDSGGLPGERYLVAMFGQA